MYDFILVVHCKCSFVLYHFPELFDVQYIMSVTLKYKLRVI